MISDIKSVFYYLRVHYSEYQILIATENIHSISFILIDNKAKFVIGD